MGCIALVRCVLVLLCGLAGVVWNTQSEYVIFIAFTLQQWLGERVSVLRYMCSACPVAYLFEPIVSQTCFRVLL